MLPQARRFFRRATIALAMGAALAVAGCGDEETPDARVRAVIAAGEAAAEARDLSGILEHVAPAFRDDQGGGREELKQYLRGYLVTHPSVHLLTRIDSIEFPYRDLARVKLTVGTLGTGATEAAGFDLAADVHDVVLELQFEDDAWRVVRAAWQSTRRG
jgi:hypothetical protein